MREDNSDANFPEEGRKSRTRIKQEMTGLQKLGESLVDLPDSFLKKTGLPADLLEAVLYAKEVRTHGARRRQRQRIGALMREVEDPSFIREALDRYHQGITLRQEGIPASPPQDRTMDLLAEELVSAGEDRIEALASRYPSLHPDRLRRLIRHARDESAGPKTRAKQALKAYLEKNMSHHI